MQFLQSFANFPLVTMYFGAALLITAIFGYLYTHMTPHDELKLIRAGNRSATISFLGTMLGFSLPMYALIRVSANLVDLVLWSVVVLFIQWLAFKLCTLYLGRSPVSEDDTDLSRNDAWFTGGIGVLVGIINMGCLH